jgi:hypothetical protein
LKRYSQNDQTALCVSGFTSEDKRQNYEQKSQQKSYPRKATNPAVIDVAHDKHNDQSDNNIKDMAAEQKPQTFSMVRVCQLRPRAVNGKYGNQTQENDSSPNNGVSFDIF